MKNGARYRCACCLFVLPFARQAFVVAFLRLRVFGAAFGGEADNEAGPEVRAASLCWIRFMTAE